VPYGFHDAQAWVGLLRAHGFVVRELDWVTLEVRSPTAEQLAVGLVRGTPVSNAIEERGGQFDRIVEAVAASLIRLGGEAPFRSTMRALVVVADVDARVPRHRAGADGWQLRGGLSEWRRCSARWSCGS
jgi:hypothetical protein